MTFEFGSRILRLFKFGFGPLDVGVLLLVGLGTRLGCRFYVVLLLFFFLEVRDYFTPGLIGVDDAQWQSFFLPSVSCIIRDDTIMNIATR